MQILVGEHQEGTGKKDKQGNPIKATVKEYVTIPDEPRPLSDFPAKTIAAQSTPDTDGKVVVVTVDGKKFRVTEGKGKVGGAPVDEEKEKAAGPKGKG